MSFWLEMRCAQQTALGCVSARNAGPQGMSPAKGDELLKFAATLARQATAQGWDTRDGGRSWVCPACSAAARAATPPTETQ